jgi:hypothetical protein
MSSHVIILSYLPLLQMNQLQCLEARRPSRDFVLQQQVFVFRFSKVAEMVLSMIVQVHLQRLELWTGRAQACEERKVEEGVVIKHQLFYSVGRLSEMASASTGFSGNIRVAVTVQETAQRVRIERHTIDKLDSLESAW